jgi:hypothetical protein
MRSTPSGAEVWLGDQRLGRTPLLRAAVRAGRQRVLVVGRDGRELAATVLVPPAGELEARAVLPRSRAPFIAGLVTAAVGLVAWATFGVLALNAENKAGCYRDAPPGAQGDGCHLRTFAVLSDVGLGITLGGGAAALLGYLWARPALEARTLEAPPR